MHIAKHHAKFADTDTYVQTVSHFLIKRLEQKYGLVYKAYFRQKPVD